MLAREDNELLTRVGPGTPMGNAMRRYWIPALLACELPEPDGPPVRVKLLGEELVAFRDSLGRVGLLDEYCPHRRASLFFGRNEECGLRCVYHGWKFDADGRCVDMLNEPEDLQFKHKIRATSYPTTELGGVIWAYMGSPDVQPPLPRFAWAEAPATHRHVSKVIQDNNWLQGVEGGIDSSHVPILHRTILTASSRYGYKPGHPFVNSKPSRIVVDLTDYGFQYAALRPYEGTDVYIRTYHFVMPFHQIRPSLTAGGALAVAGHVWVPMDDETTMVYNWEYADAPLTDEDRDESRLGNGPADVDQTTFRARRNRHNDYLLDRRVQKTETFTGIEGVNTQDRAVQESMGVVTDRGREHLGPADKAIIQARRLLLQAVKTVADGGAPQGIGPTYYTLRAAEGVVARDADWRRILAPEISERIILQTV
jgi:phenylpropionate dioxygenase-like ring-hydroxylating dioxygenase large terminal subunit